MIADLASVDVTRIEGVPVVPNLPDLLLFSDAGAEGGVVSSGGALTRWVDLSGSGGAIDQSGHVPLTGGVIGGRPALRLRPSTHLSVAIRTPLQLATPSLPALTLGIVARLADVGAAVNRTLWDMSPDAYGFGVRTSATHLDVFARANATGDTIHGWYLPGDQQALPPETATDGRLIVIAVLGPDRIRCWAYGPATETYKESLTAEWDYARAPAGTMVIGNSVEANLPWIGDIGEAWVMGSAISDSHREAYVARAKAMWLS